ncbi:unnamed protein product [Protopolystoma xenopodis]|uniref:Uncharacterized protein n=1 Tax=Protopolystoma xenopodis TaxID=117903 RepID=A0A448X1M3_9PLAT|nr:unnamed protein product [Protopolystoma xenopodis]
MKGCYIRGIVAMPIEYAYSLLAYPIPGGEVGLGIGCSGAGPNWANRLARGIPVFLSPRPDRLDVARSDGCFRSGGELGNVSQLAAKPPIQMGIWHASRLQSSLQRL